jgi:ankyrin repeat protein
MLAQLHINSLTGKMSPKSVRQTLKKLPSGSAAYDEAYKDIMERIKALGPESKSLAEHVIIWIAYSKWPLTTKELQHALAIEEGESMLDEENICQIEDIVSVCVGLVTVDEDSSVVRLVHYTAQEYFERNQAYWFPNADENIATACITYLMFENIQEQFYKGSHPLYRYAAQYWGDHARNATRNGSNLERLVMDFLERKDVVEEFARELGWRTRRRREIARQKSSALSTELHMAAHFGLDNALNTLLRHENSPDPRDYFNSTPLMLAAAKGHESIVNLLLKSGRIDPDAKDAAGRTALERAAQRGHLSIVKLLLETGKADPNCRDEDGRTPLFHAAKEGNLDVARLLLLNDQVDPNSEDDYGSTPFSIAARNGQEQAVELLLMKEGVQFYSMDKFGRTPIIWASIKGHSRIVKLLLEKYKETGVFICADDLPKATARTCLTKAMVWCDICGMHVANTESHYHCEVCHSGDFDICQHCASLGATCLNNSHKLIERSMENRLDFYRTDERPTVSVKGIGLKISS